MTEQTGGAPYRYRFTLEGKHDLITYFQHAVDAGYYGVDDHPRWPSFTLDADTHRRWKERA